MGRPLTCACARITLADGAIGVLIAAVERVGPELSLAERVARLLAANVEPVAVFDDDGALIGATAARAASIDENASLDAIGAMIQTIVSGSPRCGSQRSARIPSRAQRQHRLQ